MRYFDLSWQDLEISKQQDMIKEVAESLLDIWQEEGMEFLGREWHVKPKDWKEAYCRIYAIESSYWNDVDENSEEFQKIDWEQALQEYAEEIAEERCIGGVRKVEIEVKTGV